MDGTVFSDDFTEVAPPAREDSEVKLLPRATEAYRTHTSAENIPAVGVCS